MLTIFTNPRPFLGVFKKIQENSLKNWLNLCPDCQIILINDEKNTSKNVAKKFGIECYTLKNTNDNGLTYVNEVFALAKKKAKYKIIAQINIDILLTRSFFDNIKKIKFKRYLLVGERWDLNIKKKYDFEKKNWEKELHKNIMKRGKKHPRSGSDYWVFPKSIDWQLPPLLIGRPCIDNYLILQARKKRIPLIDGSKNITIVHQNHPVKRTKKAFYNLADQNRQLYKQSLKSQTKETYYFELKDTNYELINEKIVKKSYFKTIVYKFFYARYSPYLLSGLEKKFLTKLALILRPIINLAILIIK